MNYVADLKIAVINRDIQKIEELSGVAFESNNVAELKKAAAIVKEALKLLEKERSATLLNMKNIQKMRQYAAAENSKDLL